MKREPILVVDDNPLNVKLLKFTLESHGFTVRTAAGAQETLELLAGFRPALILMDLQLPGVDGFELTRRLRARPDTKNVPIVAVTSFAMEGDEQRARDAGCDGYVAKPIDTRKLPELVAGYLRARPARERP